MNTEVEKMVFKSLTPGKVTTSPSYCINHGISRLTLSRKALQIENYKKIQKWYDIRLSVSENYRRAKQERIKISRKTLYNYCHHMNISPSPRKRDIGEWYDAAVSVGQNFQFAKEQGIQIGKQSLYNYCKINNIPTKGTGNLP